MELRRVIQQRFPATARYVASEINSATISTQATIHELQNQLNNAMTQIDTLSQLQAKQGQQYAHLAQMTQKLQQRGNLLQYCNLEYLQYAVATNHLRVLLVGWYGAENCGDELMLRAILRQLNEVGIRPAVLLWDYFEYDADDLSNFADLLHYPNSTWDIRQLAALFDVLIWGGGAIIDEAQYDKNPTNINTGNLFIRLSEAMLQQGKQVYGISLSSTASFTKKEYLQKLQYIATHCQHFSLRDENSRAALQKAGIRTDKVTLMLDPVFSFAEFSDPDKLKLLRTHPQEKTRLGVVLMDYADLSAQHLQLLKCAATYLEQQNGEFEITLIPFFDYRNSDTAYYERLQIELGSPAWLKIAPYSHILQENAIFSCDYLISYRYHGALLASAAGIANIAVCLTQHSHYANKIHYLAQQFGNEANVLDALDFNPENFTTALANLCAHNQAQLHNAVDICAQAATQLAQLCRLISENMQ